MTEDIVEETEDVDEVLGKAAYTGYLASCKGKSLISGAPLPGWDEQAENIREAWRTAARYVVGHSADIKKEV
jgi:hypothetical protein